MEDYRSHVKGLREPDRFLESLRVLSGGSLRGSEVRGRRLDAAIVDALLWGLRHRSPVIRRRCLEILDQHPEPSAIPHIVARLDDPVPRVRRHAVHALVCDVCKAGDSFADDAVVRRLQLVAEEDPNEGVRKYARRELASAGAWPAP